MSRRRALTSARPVVRAADRADATRGAPGVGGVAGGVVIVALRLEAAALRGRTGGVPVLRCGMGPAAVARAADRIGRHPGWLSAGLAGGLGAEVRPGDLVVASEVVDGEHRYAVGDAGALGAELRHRGLRVHVGPLAASGTVVHGARRAELARDGYLAVDMESGALAALAAGGPFAAVRAVLDTPTAPLLRPGTPVRAGQALRSLRAAAPVLGDWARSVRTPGKVS